jgi:hypothetical protein
MEVRNIAVYKTAEDSVIRYRKGEIFPIAQNYLTTHNILNAFKISSTNVLQDIKIGDMT